MMIYYKLKFTSQKHCLTRNVLVEFLKFPEDSYLEVVKAARSINVVLPPVRHACPVFLASYLWLAVIKYPSWS